MKSFDVIVVGGGIQGAVLAKHQGRLAALASLKVISEGERNTLCTGRLRAVINDRMFRPFLDTLFRPLDRFRIPADPDVVVCRCEEVTAGQVRACVRLGCQGPNQLKSFCRADMGPCRGRLCGLTVSEIMAAERSTAVGRIGHCRLRPPVKPVTLGDLAALEMDGR
ncbi:MAG: (2Fe-2S)-binding protein [Rhodospirillaceae bacterium]